MENTNKLNPNNYSSLFGLNGIKNRLNLKSKDYNILIIITFVFVLGFATMGNSVACYNNTTNSVVNDNTTVMTGSWSGSGGNYNSTAGPIKVNASVTTQGNAAWKDVKNGTTNPDRAFFSNVSAPNHTSLQAEYWWDTCPEYSSTPLGGCGDDQGIGTITFKFSQIVENPILHIDRIGGMGNQKSNSALLTLITPGLTLVKLSGTNHFEVTPKTIKRTPNQYTFNGEASWDSSCGTAAGSVMVIGNASQVTFTWKGVGVEGAGDDEIEMIWAFCTKADVTLNQTVNSPVNVGNLVTYLVTATNNGPVTATNIQITDIVPAALNGVSVIPSLGTYNSTNGIWTILSLPNLASATLNITGIATTAMAGTVTNNIAIKTCQKEYDPMPYDITTAGVYTKEANVILSQTGGFVKDLATFMVTAINNGPDNATEVSIIDLIPAGLNNVTLTPSIGIYNITTGIWYIPLLANGTNATLNITGTAMLLTTIYNTANKISQAEFDPEMPDTTKLGIYMGSTDLYLQTYPWWYNSGSDSYQYQYVCGNVPVITADIQNIGFDDASGIIVEYLLPSGLKLEGYSVAMGKVTICDNKLIWNIDYMPKNGRLYMKIFARIIGTGNQTPNVTGLFNLVHLDQNDTNVANDNASCALIVNPSADIGVNMTQQLFTDNGTQYVRYTITVVNNGPDSTNSVKIKDILPNDIIWISDTSGGMYNHNTTGTGAGIWNIGTFNYGDAPKILEIVAKFNSTDTIKNTVSKFMAFGYDWNTNNNIMSTDINQRTSNVDIYLQNYPWWYNCANGCYQYQYVCGNAPVFTADVQNVGPDDATGVVVEYVLPSGLKMESYSVAIGTVSVVGNKLIWNIGYMPRGGRLYLKVFTRIIETGNQTPNVTTLFNVAHVDQNDSNTTNDNASCALITTPSADIGVNMTQQLFMDNGTQYVRYTITVLNNGPDNSTSVQIKDILPTGVEWVSDTSGGMYNHNTTGTGAGIWNIGNFATSDTPKTLVIIARVNGTGTFKNTASKSTAFGYDWNANNNAMTTVMTIPQ